MTQAKSKLLGGKKKAPKWQKPDLLAVRGGVKEPGYSYRLIKATDALSFMDGKDHRGWEIVRKGSGAADSEETFTGNISQFSKKALGSVYKVGDLILARMPQETADQRNEYYAHKARAQATLTAKAKVAKDLQGGMLDESQLSGNFKPARGQVQNV